MMATTYQFEAKHKMRRVRDMGLVKLIAGIGLAVYLLNCPALAADRPASAAELEKLEEQIRGLDKDLSVLKATVANQLDAQDKRIQDVGLTTTQQSNHLAAIANETANVGNYIGWTSFAIGLAVGLLGWFTYRDAKKQAKEEAERVSKEWLEHNEKKLNDEFERLKSEITKTLNSIAEDRQKVAIDTQATLEHNKAWRDMLPSVGGTIMQPKPEVGTVVDLKMARDANNVVQFVSESLKTKREVDFTPEEHYARGLARFADRDYTTALDSFTSALAGLPPDADAAVTTRYLLAKASTLIHLGHTMDGIAIYDNLNERFGGDPTPQVRAAVVSGLLNKAITLTELNQNEKAVAVYEDLDRCFGADDLPAVRSAIVTALINKVAILIKLGKFEPAISVYYDLDRRFGADPLPLVREQMLRAPNNLGFGQLMLAKSVWTNESKRRELLKDAGNNFDRCLKQCIGDCRALVLGNLGYTLYLLGEFESSRALTLESLTLGGQEQLNDQRNDAKKNRVEPEDTQYEEMLDELWHSLTPSPTAAS